MKLRLLIWLNKMGLIDKWRCYLCFGKLSHFEDIKQSVCYNAKCDYYEMLIHWPLVDQPMKAIDLERTDKILKDGNHD